MDKDEMMETEITVEKLRKPTSALERTLKECFRTIAEMKIILQDTMDREERYMQDTMDETNELQKQHDLTVIRVTKQLLEILDQSPISGRPVRQPVNGEVQIILMMCTECAHSCTDVLENIEVVEEGFGEMKF